MKASRSEVIDAMLKADTALRELEIEQDKPVDIFDAIRDTGLWLTFQKLSGILGATFREGAGGVLITTQRPPSVQRYTAAHELGHWHLHQGEPDWDTEESVLGNARSPREQTAQYFASSFLMPRRLVMTTLRKNGWNRNGVVSPEQAYMTSRDMGVSYTAAVQQMNTLDIVSAYHLRTLKKCEVKKIKMDLLGGTALDNSRAHIWNPKPTELADLKVSVDDEILVRLPENRTTGFMWHLIEQQTESKLQDGDESGPVLIKLDDFLRPEQDAHLAGQLVGEGGERRILLKAIKAGAWAQDLNLIRPFDAAAPPAESIKVRGTVLEDPWEENSRFYSRSLVVAGTAGDERW
jgi:Zn-dependent peptidase ImmA (M78 family)/predicted secreted protein